MDTSQKIYSSTNLPRISLGLISGLKAFGRTFSPLFGVKIWGYTGESQIGKVSSYDTGNKDASYTGFRHESSNAQRHEKHLLQSNRQDNIHGHYRSFGGFDNLYRILTNTHRIPLIANIQLDFSFCGNGISLSGTPYTNSGIETTNCFNKYMAA